jgi:hypothetical protein
LINAKISLKEKLVRVKESPTEIPKNLQKIRKFDLLKMVLYIFVVCTSTLVDFVNDIKGSKN